MPQVDNFRFVSAFSIALCVVVLSLAPVALAYITDNRGLIWRLASGVAVAYFAIGTPLFRSYAASIREEFLKSGVSNDDRFVFFGGMSFALISLENVIGWPIAPNFGSFILALLIAFLISAYTFATMSFIVLEVGVPPNHAVELTAGTSLASLAAFPVPSLRSAAAHRER